MATLIKHDSEQLFRMRERKLVYQETHESRAARNRADEIQATDPGTAETLRSAADEIDAQAHRMRQHLAEEPPWRTALRRAWSATNEVGRREILGALGNEVFDLIETTSLQSRPWRSRERARNVARCVKALWDEAAALVALGARPFDDALAAGEVPIVLKHAYRLGALLSQQIIEDETAASRAEGSKG